MNILWIGAPPHAPGNNHPSSIYSSMAWHTIRSENTLYNYLKNNHLLYAVEINQLSYNDEFIRFNGNEKAPFNNLTHCLMTWNYGHIRKKERNMIEKLEYFLRTKYPSIKIINPISRLKYLYKKNYFFELMKTNNLETIIPKYKIINNRNDLLENNFEYPYILKTNNLSGGKLSYLVSNYKEAVDTYNKLKLSPILGYVKNLFVNRVNSKVYKYDKILAVKYYNTYNSIGEFYHAARMFFFGDKLYYAYPNISKTDWCIHIHTREDIIRKNEFVNAHKKLLWYINNYKDILIKIRRIIGIHTCVIDFIISEGKIILLEPELKYGIGSGFIPKYEDKFNLDNEYHSNIQLQLNDQLVCYEDIFL